jgi:hypothetical protein
MLGYVELVSGTDLPRATVLFERAIQLAPSREQYRLYLAQALIRQREFTRATSHLGPLVASGRSGDVRNQARDLLGRVSQLQQRARTSAAEPGPVDLAPPPPPSEAQVPEPGVQTGPAAGDRQDSARPDLRPVGAGETRVRGSFRAIECVEGRISLVVESDGVVLRLRAKQLTDVDFISYRPDPPGSVGCGVMPTAQQVLATYRAGRVGSGSTGTDGDAVAIELLPDNF